MTNTKVLISSIVAIAIMIASCGDKKNEPVPPVNNPENTGGNGGDNGSTRSVWSLTSSANKSFDLKEATIQAQEGSSMAPSTIKINPSETYQTIDGFGAAITGAAAENLLKMSDADRRAFLTQTFSPTEGYGYSYIRVPIGCSDFSRTEYTLCDKEGIENFSLTSEETGLLIPVIKEILAINPSVKVLGSPWTAPRWMKVKDLDSMQPWNSWTSGQLNPNYYEDYGTYFVKWIQALAENGIKVYAITPQNEPLNRGNSASMYMSWQEQRDFVKKGLGPKLREAGLDTKIYAFDHNYNYDNIADQKNYPAKIYEDADASDYISGAAYHNYGGSYTELANIHKIAPEKELVFTETTDGEWMDGNQDKASDNVSRRLISSMEDIALGTVNNWCKGAIVWNLMLDESHGPFSPADGSCKTGYGTVDLMNDNKTIRKNAYYYIMAHMASVAKPDAIRIGTTGFSKNGLTTSAFKNTDGTYGLVLCNRNSETINLTVADENIYFPVSVPANSVVSLKW